MWRITTTNKSDNDIQTNQNGKNEDGLQVYDGEIENQELQSSNEINDPESEDGEFYPSENLPNNEKLVRNLTENDLNQNCGGDVHHCQKNTNLLKKYNTKDANTKTSSK